MRQAKADNNAEVLGEFGNAVPVANDSCCQRFLRRIAEALSYGLCGRTEGDAMTRASEVANVLRPSLPISSGYLLTIARQAPLSPDALRIAIAIYHDRRHAYIKMDWSAGPLC